MNEQKKNTTKQNNMYYGMDVNVSKYSSSKSFRSQIEKQRQYTSQREKKHARLSYRIGTTSKQKRS